MAILSLLNFNPEEDCLESPFKKRTNKTEEQKPDNDNLVLDKVTKKFMLVTEYEETGTTEWDYKVGQKGGDSKKTAALTGLEQELIQEWNDTSKEKKRPKLSIKKARRIKPLWANGETGPEIVRFFSGESGFGLRTVANYLSIFNTALSS